MGISREERDAIRERIWRATDGPWQADHHWVNGRYRGSTICQAGMMRSLLMLVDHTPCLDRFNADFIAAARTDVPALLDEVDRLCTLVDILSGQDPDGEEYDAAERALIAAWPEFAHDRVYVEQLAAVALDAAWAVNHARRGDRGAERKVAERKVLEAAKVIVAAIRSAKATIDEDEDRDEISWDWEPFLTLRLDLAAAVDALPSDERSVEGSPESTEPDEEDLPVDALSGSPVAPSNSQEWEQALAVIAERDGLREQIGRLAAVIAADPGEPASEGGAVDVAIRLIEESRTRYASGGRWAELEQVKAERDEAQGMYVAVAEHRDSLLAKVDKVRAERDEARAVLEPVRVQRNELLAERDELAEKYRQLLASWETLRGHWDGLVPLVEQLIEAVNADGSTDVGASPARFNETGSDVAPSARYPHSWCARFDWHEAHLWGNPPRWWCKGGEMQSCNVTVWDGPYSMTCGRAMPDGACATHGRPRRTVPAAANSAVASRKLADAPESVCGRCGGPNRPWAAPSPLWNEVMRGGDINGAETCGIICPTCFMVLAEEQGVAELWRLTAERIHVALQTVTPSGRVWDDQTFRWVAAEEADPELHKPCCAMHNRHCEPPSELCCYHCTEAGHPDHPTGVACTWLRTPALDRAIERWYGDAATGQELHEYLGMTWEQYLHWFATGELPENSPLRDVSTEAEARRELDLPPKPASNMDTAGGDEVRGA